MEQQLFYVFFNAYCLAPPLDIRNFTYIPLFLMCMYLILPNITFVKRLRVKSKKKCV